MTKILLLIMSPILFVFSNDKLIKEIVNDYNPKILVRDHNLTDKQLTALCDGRNHYSISCETTSVHTKNELRKKRIEYLLKEISKKYNIADKSIMNLDDKYIKYIEENIKLKQFADYCYSNICSVKTIWDELFIFEKILIFILTDKLHEYLETDFEIKNIMVNYNKIIELLYPIQYKEEFEVNINYEYIQSHLFATDKYWKEYEAAILNFLKEIDRENDIKLKKIFYSHRNNSLIAISDYFRSIKPTLHPETYNLIDIKIKDKNSFINTNKLK
jgi:hypothetical protein